MEFKHEIEIILSETDLQELIELASEPEDKDVISESEYRDGVAKWRREG